MGKVIDSSVLIAAERGQLDLRAALSDHRDESFVICSSPLPPLHTTAA